ncbi:deoxyribose-phosphate aldolase [Aquihabitans sp. G128]|uniref:deoxyribose-phosphate aldolase n=1 Tax=Aquihabitans sp. G128 TaxID=2849779 RepID=UPI001C21A397|nr:deoxyribose-phosphate aldolase [Aquihabitans sp. G128]QXC63244.1 deoxyribose-phosphate aldolase [Aquihabitans sp. G128]
MDRAALARLIDHTLLSPDATPGQIAMFCGEATTLGVGAICVSPNRLPLPAGALPGGTAVATVVGFPSGSHRPETKAAEAALAIEHGAVEIDMVIDLGLVAGGLWGRVEAEIATVRAAVPEPHNLKVIIESAWLQSDERIIAACRAAEAGGADYVKTSTGFHPAGGASLHAVALMAATVDGRLGVKASGGIRDTATAVAMVEAGATRLGCSASRRILEGLG